jgi:hypothetical protein
LFLFLFFSSIFHPCLTGSESQVFLFDLILFLSFSFSLFLFRSRWMLNKNILLFSRWLKLSYSLNHLSRRSNDVQSFITSYCLSCFLLSSTKYCLFNAVVITPASYLFSSSHALSTVSNIIFNLHLDRYLLFLYSSAIQHTCTRHLHQRKDFVFIIINRKSNSSFFLWMIDDIHMIGK